MRFFLNQINLSRHQIHQSLRYPYQSLWGTVVLASAKVENMRTSSSKPTKLWILATRKKNDMTWLNKLHPKDLIDFSGNLDECHVCRKSMLPRSLDKRRSETTTFSVILKAFAPQIPRSSPRDFRDVLTSSHLTSHSIHWLAIPSKPHSQSNFDPWQLARSQCWQGSKCETMSMAKWQVGWTSSLTGWWCLLILGIKSEAAKTPPFLGKIISPRKKQGHFEWIIPFPVKWGTVGEPWSNCRTCFTVFLLLIQPTPTLYLGWIALRM